MLISNKLFIYGSIIRFFILISFIPLIVNLIMVQLVESGYKKVLQNNIF